MGAIESFHTVIMIIRSGGSAEGSNHNKHSANRQRCAVLAYTLHLVISELKLESS